MAPIPALLQAANFARHVGVLGPMTNLHSDPSSVSSFSHSRRGRRRSLAWAAGLTAAALLLPTAADAHRFQIDDTGNATPLHEDFPDPETTTPTMPAVTADAAIVVDRATGAVLGSKSPDLRWAPASTTKIMTGLLAIEAVQSGAVSLDDTVTIRSDVHDEGGASSALRRVTRFRCAIC